MWRVHENNKKRMDLPKRTFQILSKNITEEKENDHGNDNKSRENIQNIS